MPSSVCHPRITPAVAAWFTASSGSVASSGSHLRAMVCEVVVVVAVEVDQRCGRPGLARPQLDDAGGERGDELAVVRDEDEATIIGVPESKKLAKASFE